jgi:DNA-directed RNA polymerase subunit RPC12/RpoP
MSQAIASRPSEPVTEDEQNNPEIACLRCSGTAVAKESAPDGSDAWSIYACQRCNFSWRSTEEFDSHAVHLREKYEPTSR